MKKLLVITGGSKGIGRAVVETFSSNGFDAMVAARNMPELQKLKVSRKEIWKLHSPI